MLRIIAIAMLALLVVLGASLDGLQAPVRPAMLLTGASQAPVNSTPCHCATCHGGMTCCCHPTQARTDGTIILGCCHLPGSNLTAPLAFPPLICPAPPSEALVAYSTFETTREQTPLLPQFASPSAPPPRTA